MSDNKRIAKNTIYLYIRALISLVIGLYTSRVVIDVLGVDDYGVYGVAGGVVGMLSFLNASMAGATSRFITVSLGEENIANLKIVFGNALTAHLGIALLILIICESLGIWFLNYKLNIPSESIVAANWVFQFSILTTIISITQVPYMALIMSHEHMNIYAYMEMINVSLKLVIVYLLLVLPGNKLIIYAALMAIVTTIIALSYRLYCIRKFSEAKTRPMIDKSIILPMMSFSGWDLYGNSCVTFRNQGTTFILNIFFGVAINAAASIASVLNGVISGLSYNIITAFRPQIIKSYAVKSWNRFNELIDNGALYSSLLLTVMAIPLVCETHFIFNLWLKEVPNYVVVFSRITIFSAILAQISSVITIGIHATGKIKQISFITGTLYLLSLPAIYVALRIGLPPQWAFIVALIFNSAALISNVCILKDNLNFLSVKAFVFSLAKLPIIVLPACLAAYSIHHFMTVGFLRLAAIVCSTVMLTALMTYGIALNAFQRKLIISKIFKRDTDRH